jgi:hypothetical protein
MDHNTKKKEVKESETSSKRTSKFFRHHYYVYMYNKQDNILCKYIVKSSKPQ